MLCAWFPSQHAKYVITRCDIEMHAKEKKKKCMQSRISSSVFPNTHQHTSIHTKPSHVYRLFLFNVIQINIFSYVFSFLTLSIWNLKTHFLKHVQKYDTRNKAPNWFVRPFKFTDLHYTETTKAVFTDL